MSKRKGVSAAEKRTRLHSMFLDTGAVYTLKEVEKGGSSLGIPGQAVKDVLKELCDDDMVHEGKVGVSTYYWSFVGELGTKRRTELERLSGERAAYSEQIAAGARELHDLEAQQPCGDDEGQLRKAETRIASLQSERDALQSELASLKDSDAKDVHSRQADIPVLKDAANRWTDNIFVVRKRLLDSFGMNGDDLDKQLGIQGLDYLE